MNIYIGFDFSINKPACSVMYFKDGELHHKFFIWPIHLTKKEEESYSKVDDVIVRNRNLESVHKDKESDSSKLTLLHTKRSVDLSDMIIRDLEDELEKIENENHGDDFTKIYICSEGLSFGSAGDATLNLATYKGVMLADIYRYIDTEEICTYSPLSIKSVAGCAGKEVAADKHAMINAFLAEHDFDSTFRNVIVTPEFKSKVNYIHCVDDIVDSYWAIRTMYKKLGFTEVGQWNASDRAKDAAKKLKKGRKK